MVSKVAENASPSSCPNTSNAKYLDVATRPSACSPTLPKVGTDWLSAVRQMLMAQGIQGEPMEITPNCWREGTKKQWAQHCSKNNVDQTKPSLAQILGFLAKLSSTLRYSAVATTRSALSSFIQLDGMKLGDHPLVTRFMTGLFNKKPALPRYVEIWNPQSVLEYLRNYPNTRELSLKQLTVKLTALLASVTAQRPQTLQALSLDGMRVSEDQYTFRVLSLFKQSLRHGGTNRHLAPIVLKRYHVDNKLCVVTLLNEYLIRTSQTRSS